MTAGEIARWRHSVEKLDLDLAVDHDARLAARHVVRAHRPAVGAAVAEHADGRHRARLSRDVPGRGHGAVGGRAARRGRSSCRARRTSTVTGSRRDLDGDGAAGRRGSGRSSFTPTFQKHAARRAAACSSTSRTPRRSGRIAPASRSSRRATTRRPTQFRVAREGVRVRRQDPRDRPAARHRRRAQGHRGRRVARRPRAAVAARRGHVRRGERRRTSCTSDATASRCSAAASTRRMSPTSWSRSTCSRPASRRALVRARRSAIRSARRSRRYDHRVAMCELAAAPLGAARAGQPRRARARAAPGLRREPDARPRRAPDRARTPMRSSRLVVGADILGETRQVVPLGRASSRARAADRRSAAAGTRCRRARSRPASRCPRSRRPTSASSLAARDPAASRRCCRAAVLRYIAAHGLYA